MKRLAVYNIKGGVGKTTSSVNLACLLASQGYSVLLWDFDPQGGSSFFFNLQNKNNNTHSRLFDRYITIYDVIKSTDTHQIDIIGNDSLFSDQFMNNAAKITALDYMNHDLINSTLKEVEDDYDICIFDCPPGKFILHHNIFKAADAILVPNIPSPLSVYCNNLLLGSLIQTLDSGKNVLSFFNMVQAQKNIHKFYLEQRATQEFPMLENYIPFYTEIESINIKKESIFHQLKKAKTVPLYMALWNEIINTTGWKELFISPTPLVSIDTTTITDLAPVNSKTG